METELWPNLLKQCADRGINVLLANARLSARSAAGYGHFLTLMRRMLSQVHTVAAQTEADGARFLALGLPEQRLRITGSIKWDVSLGSELRDRAAALAAHWDSDRRPVLVAASTHPGEEALLLAAADHLRMSFPDLLLVLVPRHPERFEDRKSTRLNSSHSQQSRMPSSA